MGTGMPVRRANLHHQIQPSEEAAGVTRRRCSDTSPVAVAPESPPFNDDMLREILIRLPPRPSSLPRASAVCRRWLEIVTDPKFHRQFRAHHRKPPLLGAFMYSDSDQSIEFTPFLDSPDRIAPERFSLGRCSDGEEYSLLDCRHGLVLIKDFRRNQIVVCDPIIGEQRWMSVPPEFESGYVNSPCVNGAVVCAADGLGHVHGGCRLSSCKVVLVSTGRSDDQHLACVYSLETGLWDNLISTEAPSEFFYGDSSPTLVGNVLYWLLGSDCILEFDLDRQSLAMTKGPLVTNDGDRQIILAEDGALGFGILDQTRFQMWHRNISCQGVATWLSWKTIEMHNMPGLSLQIGGDKRRWLLGYDEDNDVIFVYVSSNVYAVQLKSMESKKLYKTSCVNEIHPFKSFYTPGIVINGGSNGAEMLHDTEDACLP
uniref:Uncharacterized protein n=3 Tax=Avena sativa TaxID=4498 RepID=A0ACD5VDV5_AVESA